MKQSLDEHVAAYEGNNLYDFDNEIIMNWYSQRIVAESKGSKSLLELGLGHGFSTNAFSKFFDTHVVVEGSQAIIRNFGEMFPECPAQIIESRFEDFFTEERFDVIVMGFILEHVDDPSGIMSRFKRFLAPEGKFYLAVPNAEALNRRLGYHAGLLENMQMLSENDLLLGHKRYYTVASLTEEIHRAGFEIDMMEGIYLKPMTTRQIVSLNLDKEIIRALCEVGMNYPELSCGILAKISAP